LLPRFFFVIFFLFFVLLFSQADIYTVFLGTNDSKFYNWFGVQNNSGDSYALDYLELLKRLRGLKERVVLVPVIPVRAFVPQRILILLMTDSGVCGRSVRNECDGIF
jgi:hypothetical protein